MLTEKEANKRVDKGVAVLDKKIGEDWVFKIRPMKLDLADECRCVVGQLYYDEATSAEAYNEFDDPFSYGIRKLRLRSRNINNPDGFNQGFDVGWGEHEDFGVLTRVWQKRIRQLRKERKALRVAA